MMALTQEAASVPYNLDDKAAAWIAMPLTRLRSRVSQAGWRLAGLGESTHAHMRLIDSSDWRLCRNGSACVVVDTQSGPRVERLLVDTRRQRQTIDELPQDRSFATPTPAEGEIVETLIAACPQINEKTANRRLLVLGALTVKESRYRIVDGNGKTLAVVDSLTPNGRGEQSFLSLRPLRGFGKTLYPLVNSIETGDDSANAFVQRLARSQGRSLFDYGGKPTVPLDKDISSADAYERIVSYLFDVLHANVAGVLDRIDDEFLHDFRVALRRLRTVISSLDVELPKADADAVRRLWDATGEARDLDVFLAQQYKLREEASPAVKQELAGLFSRLEDLRSEAYARLGRLVSLRSLSTLKNALLSAKPAAADDAIGSRVEKLIRRRDKKFEKAVTRLVASRHVARAGSDVGEAAKPGDGDRPPTKPGDGAGSAVSPGDAAVDELLHAARIQAKKARYVREVFSGLPTADRRKHGGEVKRLRKLQDALGAYNDLVTEESHMHDLLAGRDRFGTVRAAIGYLLAHIEREKARAREAVITRLDQDIQTNRRTK